MKGRPVVYTVADCTFRFDQLRAVNLGEKGKHTVWVHLYILGMVEPIKVQLYPEKHQELLSAWRAFNGDAVEEAAPAEEEPPKPALVFAPRQAEPPAQEGVEVRLGRSWTEADEINMKNDWLSNMPLAQLSKKYGRTEEAIKHRLRKMGIKTPGSLRRHKASKFLR